MAWEQPSQQRASIPRLFTPRTILKDTRREGGRGEKEGGREGGDQEKERGEGKKEGGVWEGKPSITIIHSLGSVGCVCVSAALLGHNIIACV